MDSKGIKIYEAEGVGEVYVNEDVIAVIAGLAATEVEGVDSMAGGITNEIVAKLGKKNLSAGVSIQVNETLVSVAISLIVRMGYSIPDISTKVQEKVKNAIENMTGLTVEKVDVKIANVKIDK